MESSMRRHAQETYRRYAARWSAWAYLFHEFSYPRDFRMPRDGEDFEE